MAEKQMIRKPPVVPNKKFTGKVKNAQDVLRVMGRFDELQYFDIGLSGGTPVGVVWNPLISSLSDVAQGTGDSNREGDRLNPRRLDLTLTLYNRGSSQDARRHFVRVIVLRWNQDSTVGDPVGSDIISSGFLTTQAAPLGTIINDNFRAKKFDLLLDELVALDNAHDTKVITKVMTLPKEIPIQFQTASVNGTGKLYLYVVSDESSGTACPQYNFISRLYYYSN